MFVRPTVHLVFRLRNMYMLSKFVSAKPLVLLKLLFRSQHIMSSHDRPTREIPWGRGVGGSAHGPGKMSKNKIHH